MSLKETLKDIGIGVWTQFKPFLRAFIAIGTIFGMFWFFRFIGLKGMLGFVIGMGIMSYLILSKNPMLQWVIDFTSADSYIDNMRGKDGTETGRGDSGHKKASGTAKKGI